MALGTRRGRRRLTLVAASLAVVGATPAPAGAALPPIKHVFVIVLENESYAATFGPGSRVPYLSKTLPSEGAQLANYYAIGHQSLDNYIAMISGQAPNVVTQADCASFLPFVLAAPAADGQVVGQGCVYPASVRTVADQLQAGHLTWKGYMEDMANGPPGDAKSCRHPAIGARDQTQRARPGDQYAARHNPFVYFRSLIDSPACAQNDVDFSRLATDLRSPATTPNYAFITPNLCNDGHDDPCVDDPGHPGGQPKMDAWLRREVPKILDSPGFRDDGLLVVTFDEAEASGSAGDASACCDERPGPNTLNPGGFTLGPGGGRVGAVLVSPFVAPGTFLARPYNHYSLLRSVEDLFELGHLGMAGRPGVRPFGSDVFNRTPRLRLKVSPARLRHGRAARLRIAVERQATISFGGVCRARTRRTDPLGRLRVRLRPRRRGRCRIRASRPAWLPAGKRIRVR